MIEGGPSIFVVGPTASGKTALAIRLAEQISGEIICADSRTVYKGMDIGTAKPTTEDQSRVPHWGIDVVSPDEKYTAAQFQQYAQQKMYEVWARGNVPIIVGGTGLYVDGLLFQYSFGALADTYERRALTSMSVEQLVKYCVKNNIQPPNNTHNKRHLIRAIEQKGINNKRKQNPLNSSIVVGLATENCMLKQRIKDRTEQLLNNGVVEEAIMLGKKYGWSHESMTGNIYPIACRFARGELTQDEFSEQSCRLDWQLAKRQKTWFYRNPFIAWGSVDEVYEYCINNL